MTDSLEEKRKKYRIKTKSGHLLYFTAFEDIVIRGKLNSFLRNSPGGDYGSKPMYRVMMEGDIQYLCLWESDMSKDISNKTIVLAIGCNQAGMTGIQYNVYYEVFQDNKISLKIYNMFEEAFQDFKKRVISS